MKLQCKFTKFFFMQWVVAALSIFFFCLPLYATLDYLDEGSVHLKGEYYVGMMNNQAIGGWKVLSDGIQKSFVYNSSSGGNGGTSIMNMFTLDASSKFNKRFSGSLVLDIFGGYYDTLYRPVNDIHRNFNKKQYMRLRKADLTYERESLRARYFEGTEHYHWMQEGDIFGLYPAQFETERYRNISGRSVPQGGEIQLKSYSLGSLLLVGGEPIWGYRDSLYGRYNYRIGIFDNTITSKYEKVPYSESEEYLQASSFATKLTTFPIEFGFLYQPFRLGKSYTKVEKTSQGSGYIVENYKTETQDALGYSISLFPKNIATFDEIMFRYAYRGLIAGNNYEFSSLFRRRMHDSFLISCRFIWRDNLEKANPYLHEGSVENPGPVQVSPRGANDPFWVTQENRKATIMNLTLTYDPSVTGFSLYKYEPANVEWWNLNEEPNIDFAGAVSYTLSHYPTNTDRQYYYNSEGDIVWEPFNVYGLWATKQPLHFIDVILKSHIPPRFNLLMAIRGGQSLATGAMPYVDDKYKSITEMFTVDAKIAYKPFMFELGYGKDVWGPEEWQRRFGIVINKMYKAGIGVDFKKWGALNFLYRIVRQDDYKDVPAVDIGSFNEMILSWSWKCNIIFNFKEPEFRPGEEQIETGFDKEPPRIKVKADTAFSPNGDGINDVLDIRMKIKDESGIDSWWISLYNEKGEEISTLASYRGRPPDVFEWDGMDSDRTQLPVGSYFIFVGASDVLGNIAVSKSLHVEIRRPPKFSDISLIQGILKYGVVKEEARGLVIIFYRDVVFDDKLFIKPEGKGAFNQLCDILKTLEDYKVRIEVYTDPRGRKRYNSAISLTMGGYVKNYMVTQGIPKKMIEIRGLGGTKPLYMKGSKEQRRKNNRIEIVISY